MKQIACLVSLMVMGACSTTPTDPTDTDSGETGAGSSGSDSGSGSGSTVPTSPTGTSSTGTSTTGTSTTGTGTDTTTTTTDQATVVSSVNVRAFHAVGDGVTDDRAAIQAALNSGAQEVVIPNGTFVVGMGAGYWCLTVPAGVTLRGETRDGAIIQQAAGIGASVRLLQIAADNVTVRDLTLDGNHGKQTVDEHRSGVFATGANNLTLRRVTARGFSGDGFYLYLGSNNAMVDSVLATGNDRNGITFGGGTTSGTVTKSSFVGNAAQQFDSEPGSGATVDGLTITNNTLDAQGQSNDYVLTVSGSSSKARSKGWTVANNTLNGPTYIVWADNITLSGNVGVNPTTKPAAMIYRTSDGVTITNNTWTMSAAGASTVSALSVVGTGTGSAPSNVTIDHNSVSFTGKSPAFGVNVSGALSVSITDNILSGPGRAAAGYAGVFLRATDINDAFRTAVVERNTISNWGAYGVSIAGNSTAKLSSVVIVDNLFEDTAATMTTAASLDDGTGAAKSIALYGNTLTGGVKTLAIRIPTGATLNTTGN